jgi:hypothetical protein
MQVLGRGTLWSGVVRRHLVDLIQLRMSQLFVEAACCAVALSSGGHSCVGVR